MAKATLGDMDGAVTLTSVMGDIFKQLAVHKAQQKRGSLARERRGLRRVADKLDKEIRFLDGLAPGSEAYREHSMGLAKVRDAILARLARMPLPGRNDTLRHIAGVLVLIGQKFGRRPTATRNGWAVKSLARVCELAGMPPLAEETFRSAIREALTILEHDERVTSMAEFVLACCELQAMAEALGKQPHPVRQG